VFLDTWRTSFKESIFDKRTQEVKVNSTKATQEIVNTLQNSTIVRKQVDAHQRTGSQVECAAIDSINREKVQDVICSSESRYKQSNGTFAMFGREHTSEIECGYSRGNKPFQQ